MARRKGKAFGLASLLLALAVAPAMAEEPVSVGCTPSGKRCTASMISRYPDSRSGQSAVTVTLTREGECSTLTVIFDRTIATDQPVRLEVPGNGAQPAVSQTFYTGPELGRLAKALDDGSPLPGAPPEFARFLDDAAHGGFDEQEPAREMLNRFAAIKESRGLALTCGPASRLLPAVDADHPARLEFQIAPRAITRVYHWPELDRRMVELRLDRLTAALDRSPAGAGSGSSEAPPTRP